MPIGNFWSRLLRRPIVIAVLTPKGEQPEVPWMILRNRVMLFHHLVP
jgi:hypothetical protein